MARAGYRLDILGLIPCRPQRASEKSSIYCVQIAKSSHLDLGDRRDRSRNRGCSGPKIGLQQDMGSTSCISRLWSSENAGIRLID